MEKQYVIGLADPRATLAIAGGKGASLARLASADFPVPVGFHITTGAYRRFVEENDLQPRILEALETVDVSDPASLEKASKTITKLFLQSPVSDDIAGAVVQVYASLPGESPAVAVRSSATAEDLPEASFAGQQETYLNIRGEEALLNAVRRCWASLWTARAISYRARNKIEVGRIALAVVVQLLVSAEAAGILFTANPVNGRRDQMLVNASWGLGEAVVGGHVTPDILTLGKSSGGVIEREIAEKLVQTVRVDGGTEERPVPDDLRRAPILSETQAVELARLGNRIEDLYGMPMDIEWALAGGEFAILQARPITALPEPEAPVPTEWKLPKGAYVAMRNNIVELMADSLTPLFRTMGLRAVNASMNRLLFGFFGRKGILPDEPIIAVNEYAYYNGSIKFGPMMRIFLNARSIMKYMFTGAVERWTEDGRPKYIQTVEEWRARDWHELPTTEILDTTRQFSEAAIDAYGALVSGIIPAAWMSEAWFTFIYKLLKRRDDPAAPTYLMGFNSLPIRADKALYDLAQWAGKRPSLAGYLSDTPTSILVADLGETQIPAGVEVDEWMNWRKSFRGYIEKFGHTIYNLDFGNSVPADDPAPILETLKMYLSGQGVDPHERQRASEESREKAVQAMQSRLKGWRLKLFRKNLERAQKYAPLREDGLADVGYSYPLLREMLRELGRRFVEGELIEDPDDIYWLIDEEVEESAARLDRSEKIENLSPLIPQRKAIWRASKRTVPPLMLPQMKIFGVDLVELRSGRKKSKGNILKGVAASPGSATASACVVHGPEDFFQMKAGDVLVAPLTTPAWTPLFARAAAIVTDVGGPLSHGSIVAREYGIPAVLGTGSATKRIQSGQMITVDGSAGEVLLENSH